MIKIRLNQIRKFLFLLFFSALIPAILLAQKGNISGKITESDGSPIPGVFVSLKGTTIGTTSKINGEYSLNLEEKKGILVFSFIGFLTKEININTQSEILNIVLESDNKQLNEVVVVGYGSQKRGDITGAISSISEKALKEVPVTSAPQMLQGRAAGVYVLNTGNKPGSGASVQIRGRRSFNAGNDPLYVVDGIPISGGFNDINPNDIQNIDILKDASATAIYGSRGANGVILITTKRGKVGQTSVSYNNYFGVSEIQRYADVFTGPEFAEYKRESRRASIDPKTNLPRYIDSDPTADSKLFEAVELKSIKEGLSTDYQRLMIKNGYNQNHELSILGGSENTRFNLSLGYFDDKGIIEGQDFTRYTTRFNIDQNIGKRFKVGLSTLGSYSNRNGENVNPYAATLVENPLGIPFDDKGNLIFLPTSDGLRTNPLSELVSGAVINQGKRFRLLNSLYGEAQIIEGLKFRMNFGPDLIQNRRGDFRGRFTNGRRGGDPTAGENEDFVFAYTWENVLTYNKTFAKKHNFGFTGLYGVQTRQIESSNISVTGLPVETLEFYNLGSAGIINGVGSRFEKWSILSYMARFNYSFDDRFLLTLTGRADGSSKFAKGNQWGYFPSAALGWNVMNEGFMSDIKSISNLRLRLSYGQTGNEGIDPYQTPGLLSRTVYDFDGSAAFGYRPFSIRNNDLRWETTATANVGIDFGFLNNRISGTIEAYRSKTTDLLLPLLLPITSGYGSILFNVGSKRNTGLEFSISTLNIEPKSKNGFEWSTDLNLFTNKEEITELSQGKVDDIGNARFIGQPARVYYDYEKTGIWQLGEEAQAKQFASKVGQIKINDANGNGVIDPNDRKILGSDVPKLTGGLTNRFGYKNLDLSILTFARLGSMIQSPLHRGQVVSLFGRYNNFNVDYWTPTNPTNEYPQPNADQESPLYGSTLQYFDGSFVKIRNINFGYNFPDELARKFKAQSLRVYLSAQNPFVFSSYVTKYNGIDPEIDPSNPNTDTPAFRTFLLGFNLKF